MLERRLDILGREVAVGSSESDLGAAGISSFRDARRAGGLPTERFSTTENGSTCEPEAIENSRTPLRRLEVREPQLATVDLRATFRSRTCRGTSMSAVVTQSAADARSSRGCRILTGRQRSSSHGPVWFEAAVDHVHQRRRAGAVLGQVSPCTPPRRPSSVPRRRLSTALRKRLGIPTPRCAEAWPDALSRSRPTIAFHDERFSWQRPRVYRSKDRSLRNPSHFRSGRVARQSGRPPTRSGGRGGSRRRHQSLMASTHHAGERCESLLFAFQRATTVTASPARKASFSETYADPSAPAEARRERMPSPDTAERLPRSAGDAPGTAWSRRRRRGGLPEARERRHALVRERHAIDEVLARDPRRAGRRGEFERARSRVPGSRARCPAQQGTPVKGRAPFPDPDTATEAGSPDQHTIAGDGR